MARTDNLTNFLTDVADAIKEKKGDTTAIQASEIDTEIANLPSGGGSGDDWLEQNFNDGNLRLFVSLQEGRLHPYMRFNCSSDTVTVDWGDGSDLQIASGSVIKVNHNYEKVGNYIITVSPSDGITLNGNDLGQFLFKGGEFYNEADRLYICTVRKLELGKCKISTHGLDSFYSITKIFIPNTMTYFPNFSLYFNTAMLEYDFTTHKTVPGMSEELVLRGIPKDCIIKVPLALETKWKNATNWSAYASHIVGV